MKRRVRLISVLVLASALGTGCSVRREQEATLKQHLRMVRQAIDKYTLAKKEAPQSLQELVSGHYLKEIPTDPFTLKKDWVPEFSDTVLTIDQTTNRNRERAFKFDLSEQRRHSVQHVVTRCLRIVPPRNAQTGLVRSPDFGGYDAVAEYAEHTGTIDAEPAMVVI